MSRARADETAERTVEAGEYAAEIETALEEYQQGHFEEARGLFQHAHQLDPSARTLRGLGMVEFELRHYVRASELLEQSLKERKKALTEAQRADVEKLLRRTGHYVARYTLEVAPADAHDVVVRLDDAEIARDASGSITVSVGEHRIGVEASGYANSERHVDATGGDVTALQFSLVANHVAPDSPTSASDRVRRPHRTLGAVLLTSGGAVLAGGAALGVVALLAAKDAPAAHGSEADRASHLALASDGVVALGAATALTGLVFLLWRKIDRVPATGRVAVDSVGTQLRVRF